MDLFLKFPCLRGPLFLMEFPVGIFLKLSLFPLDFSVSSWAFSSNSRVFIFLWTSIPYYNPHISGGRGLDLPGRFSDPPPLDEPTSPTNIFQFFSNLIFFLISLIFLEFLSRITVIDPLVYLA